ncbi:MAG: uL22 family ribosomal protein [Candidatus Pacearchaeota archaeon]
MKIDKPKENSVKETKNTGTVTENIQPKNDVENKKLEVKGSAKEKIVSKKEEKTKKEESIVNAYNLPISTKVAVAICRFIKGKKIQDAISDLEQVIRLKKAIPMTGEIPHRKGKIMSGRFPKSASKEFIRVLKNLLANANYNNIENPIIFEAIPNKGSRPYGRFGTVRRKRTHLKIIAKSLINK